MQPAAAAVAGAGDRSAELGVVNSVQPRKLANSDDSPAVVGVRIRVLAAGAGAGASTGAVSAGEQRAGCLTAAASAKEHEHSDEPALTHSPAVVPGYDSSMLSDASRETVDSVAVFMRSGLT